MPVGPINLAHLALGALAAILCASPALPAEPADQFADHIEVDSVANVGSFGSYYADFSVTLSPYAPYYESGLKFRFTASDTRYTYFGDSTRTFISKGQDAQADLLLGYGFQFDRWSLLLLGGPSFVWSWQTPGDSSAPFSEAKTGAKASISIYGNPSDSTLVYAEASYSTASTAYYAQAKFGYAFWPSLPHLYLGPEVSAGGRAVDFDSIGTGFQQWRAGAFISGLTLGPLQFGLSAGYLNDRQQGGGGYVGTSLSTTF